MKAEECWRILVEHARDAIFVVAQDTRIRDANRAAEASHGLPRSRIVGASFLDLIAPKGREAVGGRFLGMAETGGATDRPVVLRHGEERVSVVLNGYRPRVKVLSMSGYPHDAIVRQGLVAEGAHFLQRPFTPDALAPEVRESLDAGESRSRSLGQISLRRRRRLAGSRPRIPSLRADSLNWGSERACVPQGVRKFSQN